jgi:hypothetical protein
VPPSRHSTAVPGRRAKVFVGALAVLAIGHSLLIGLWVVPANPVRDAVGTDRLSAYVNPWFQQSWSVFAPTPRRADESFAIRALRVDPHTGKKRVTAWFDITRDDGNRQTLNPARIESAPHRLAGDLNGAVATFNLAQQDLVQDRLADPLSPDLRKALLDPDVGPVPARPAAVTAYLRNDEMAVRFATMYAAAQWGGRIEQVQYRLGHREVPPYAGRTDFAKVKFDVRTFGWRKAIAGGHSAQTGFDSYVER